MSTKELAYSILDSLSEEQLRGFIMLFSGSSETRQNSKEIPEVDPDEIDLQMIAEAEADDSTGEPIEDFANRLGIDL